MNDQGLTMEGVVQRPGGFSLELTLRLPPGRTVALLGPNGAGKSTAVALMAGLLALDSGRLELDGQLLDHPATGTFVPAEARRLGVVFQDSLLFPHMTAMENIAFGLQNRGMPAAEVEEVSRRWLQRMELEGLGTRRPQKLSGGQAQRVALARALALGPRILLLDEPLSALDVATRSGLRRLLTAHLADFSGPRLLITHDPDEAFQLADEIHLLEEGRITQSGDADDIRLRPRTPYAAELAGTNLLVGIAEKGRVEVEGTQLHVAHPELEGAVRLTIRPSAVAVHTQRPAGSPRNSWSTMVERVEVVGPRVRLLTGSPLRLVVEVTPGARTELGLERGTVIWLAVKATDIGVEPGE